LIFFPDISQKLNKTFFQFSLEIDFVIFNIEETNSKDYARFLKYQWLVFDQCLTCKHLRYPPFDDLLESKIHDQHFRTNQPDTKRFRQGCFPLNNFLSIRILRELTPVFPVPDECDRW